MTFTSQNYGAEKYERVDKVTVYCQIFTVATGLILGNLMFYYKPQQARTDQRAKHGHHRAAQAAQRTNHRVWKFPLNAS